MRADARRNRDRVLLAARDLVLERGPAVPLEEVADTAGVGVGTLYRHFPDRRALLTAVVHRALTSTAEAAERAGAEEADPFTALARYLREALELRVSAVLPAVLDVLDLDGEDVAAARARSAAAVEDLVAAAHAAGLLAPDVTVADVGTMLVRISRPLPGPLPPEVKDDLARRHLELFLRALDPRPGPRAPLPGAAMTFADLRHLREGP